MILASTHQTRLVDYADKPHTPQPPAWNNDSYGPWHLVGVVPHGGGAIFYWQAFESEAPPPRPPPLNESDA